MLVSSHDEISSSFSEAMAYVHPSTLLIGGLEQGRRGVEVGR